MIRSRLSSALIGVTLVAFSLVAVVSASLIATKQTQSLDQESSYRVQQIAKFSVSELLFDKLQGYDMARLKGGDYLTELGKPMLPLRELSIALPAGMTVQSLQVVDTTAEEIPGEYNILPAQPPISIELSDSKDGFVPPDPTAYSSNQPFPSVLARFVRQTDLAGQGIAVVQIYPLQYVASQRKLILYTSMTLIVEGIGGYQCGDYLSPKISEKGKETYRQMIKDMVANPEDVQLNQGFKITTPMVLPGGLFEHVIITSSNYASYFQPLVDWHMRKGVKDTVVTTSWIYTNYAGTDTQKIRAFVIDANTNWGTTYFLLGGENETVPFAYRRYYTENTPSDQYYSDFDDDWTNEVFVGRVSVGSTTEVSTFVNKVLKYEIDPPRTNYPLNVLLVGMDLDASTHGQELKDTIDNHIPLRFNVNKVYDSYGGNHRDSVLYYLNTGQHLVNQFDHDGATLLCTGWLHHGWYINQSAVDSLENNNKLCILVSPGCWANWMDSSDCIAEHFVLYNPNRAGVAFAGNTRKGLYAVAPFTELYSSRLDKEWWMALFDRDKYNLGEILVDSKHHFNTSDTASKHCEWTFNLLGEPEMPIWTDTPKSLTVNHPSTLRTGSPSDFLVHVQDSSTQASVESAYVCLWKGNEVYLSGYTNVSGNTNLNPAPSTPGAMYVTVTKHNRIPYEGQASAIFDNLPPQFDLHFCVPSELNCPGDRIVAQYDSVQICATNVSSDIKGPIIVIDSKKTFLLDSIQLKLTDSGDTSRCSGCRPSYNVLFQIPDKPNNPDYPGIDDDTGQWVICAWAVDSVGNQDTICIQHAPDLTWKIDTQKPRIDSIQFSMCYDQNADGIAGIGDSLSIVAWGLSNSAWEIDSMVVDLRAYFPTQPSKQRQRLDNRTQNNRCFQKRIGLEEDTVQMAPGSEGNRITVWGWDNACNYDTLRKKLNAPVNLYPFVTQVTPGTQFVRAGQPADYNVMVTTLFGSPSPCTLTVTGIPPACLASFNPYIVVPTDTSLLTVYTEDGTPVGRYTLTITAMELGKPKIEHSTQAILDVTHADPLWIFSSGEVDLKVTDPVGDSIGLGFNTIQDATYDTADNVDTVTIPHSLIGSYQIKVMREPHVGSSDTTYSIGIRIDGSLAFTMTSNPPPHLPDSGYWDTYNYYSPPHRGDTNGDAIINLGDVVYLINYAYRSGPAPNPLTAGDINCDGSVNLGDIVYLINYLFKSGPPPRY